MSGLLTRRTLVTAGLTTAAGASGIGAAVYFADRYGLIPPDHAGVLGIGETLTYAAIHWRANSPVATFQGLLR